MPPPWHSSSTSPQPPGLFPQTDWPAITYSPAAAEEKRDRAREQVCRDYWRPVFLLIRARGRSPEEAEDLTQGFWLRFFQSDALSRAHPDKGRFRDFLLSAVRHYLADQCDRERTQRRGGGAPHLSLDAPQAPPLATGAAGLEEEPRGCAADRAWAEAILARALILLETKYQRPGRRELFRALRPSLLGENDAPPSYAELARALGRPEDTLRSEAARLRKQFAASVEQALLAQVGPERMDEEWQNLLEILRQQ